MEGDTKFLQGHEMHDMQRNASKSFWSILKPRQFIKRVIVNILLKQRGSVSPV